MRAFLCAILLLPSCVIQGDQYPRPSELDPSWLIKNIRVLAIEAEPPEVRPGETATFEALVAHPVEDTAELVRTWFACPATDDGIGFGCTFEADPSTLTSDTPDLDALLASGLIGVQPGWDPSFEAPLDQLDDLTPEERLEGSYALVQLTVLEEEGLNDASGELDPGELAIAYKRLVVSEARTPNHNPSFAAFTVEGYAPHQDDVVLIDPDQPYELGVAIAEDTIETYSFINGDGLEEERVEEPYVTWYTTGGTLLEPLTLHPYTQADWVSPKRSGIDGIWYAVARDRRGGMTWWRQAWRTR